MKANALNRMQRGRTEIEHQQLLTNLQLKELVPFDLVKDFRNALLENFNALVSPSLAHQMVTMWEFPKWRPGTELTGFKRTTGGCGDLR